MIHIPGSFKLTGTGRWQASKRGDNSSWRRWCGSSAARDTRQTSVADVIEEAGTSRTTFYKHFDDKHECFLAAYDMLVERVFGEVVANCDGDQPGWSGWRAAWRRSSSFALDPELARTRWSRSRPPALTPASALDAVTRFTEFLEDGGSWPATASCPRTSR